MARGRHAHRVAERQGQDPDILVQDGARERRQSAVGKAQAQRNDVHSAPVGASHVVPPSADQQVRHAVAVEVALGRHGRPEVITGVQDGSVFSVVVDLHGALYRAVCVHQHHMHGARVGASRFVPVGARRQIRHAVAVQVAKGRHGRPEVITDAQAGAVLRAAADLDCALYRVVAVHQYDVYRTPVVEYPPEVLMGADCQIGHAVSVQIVQKRHGTPKEIHAAQAEAQPRAVQLGGALYRAAGMHPHQVHGSRVAVPGGGGGQVCQGAVTGVAHGRHGVPKVVI